MDNVNVIVSESNDSIVVMSVFSVPPNSNDGIDLGGFDLDEALAAVTGESRPLLAASKSFVSMLPAVEAEEVREEDVCSVCMEGFHQGEDSSSSSSSSGGGNKRVPCGHVYHSECITLWLSHCNSCPLCRRHIFLNYDRN